MTCATNPYDALYQNLKNKFTVICGGNECSVGDYLLLKAGARSSDNSSLPTTYVNEHKTLTNLVEYVSDRLTIKNPPMKDKTIKRFPLRTSVSAALSSAAACALVLSCGILALNGNQAIPETASASEESSYVEQYQAEQDDLMNVSVVE